MTNPTLEKIYWFPLKGFPGVSLPNTPLLERAGIPHDRKFAITRGTTATGGWMPARSYYINSRVDGLQTFEIERADKNGMTLSSPSGSSIDLDFSDSGSIEAANKNLSEFISTLPIEADLPAPRIVERSDGGSNWDYPDTAISIINSASTEQVADALGKDMDPLRYRGNLVVFGMAPWEEFGLMGKRIRIGEAEIEVMRPIVRCPAPGVDPETGERDIDFEALMPPLYGHAYCGMYGYTAKTGKISAGDEVEVIGDAEISLVDASAEAEDYRLWPRIVELTTYEVGPETTRISIAKTGPWPLPQPNIGQRVRFHLGPDEWTSEYITAVSPGHYHLEVDKSETDDPVTEKLRTGLAQGAKIVVSGPFGRVQ